MTLNLPRWMIDEFKTWTGITLITMLGWGILCAGTGYWITDYINNQVEIKLVQRLNSK